MVNKTDIQNEGLSSNDLIQVANGETVSAEIEDQNNLLTLNALILAYNWIIDSGLQVDIAQTFTEIQTFSVGLKTNLIETLTPAANMVINTTGGKIFKDSTDADNELLTVASGNAAVAAAQAAQAAAEVAQAGAETAETNAETAETNAETAETNAETSATNALASENRAFEWANNPENVPVTPGFFSAFHWALQAQQAASPMVGATASTDGVGGTVPSPLTGEQLNYLRGDATWAVPEGIFIFDIRTSGIRTAGGFTLDAGTVYHFNTVGGTVTVDAPLNPTSGQVFGVIDALGSANSEPILIARNGQNFRGLAEDYSIDVKNAVVYFTFVDVTTGWVLL